MQLDISISICMCVCVGVFEYIAPNIARELRHRHLIDNENHNVYVLNMYYHHKLFTSHMSNNVYVLYIPITNYYSSPYI